MMIEGQEIQARQCPRQAFIVTREAAKPDCPPKAALDHRAERQQDETFLGFRQLDHLQLHTMDGCVLPRLFASVALVHIGQFDRLASNFLDVLGQLLDLDPILLVGNGHM